MHTDFFNSAESAVTYAATAAEVILLVRLAWLGLLREFKVFSLFLAFDAVSTAALIGWNYQSNGYEWVWAVSSPLFTLLLAGAVYELSRGLIQPIPRETGSRITALYGFLIGMTISAVASMLAHPQAILRSTVLFTIISRKCILSGCILGILAQGAYLTLGGAPLIANWRVHRRILLTFMTALVVGLFTANSKHRQFAEWMGLLRDSSLFACLCLWITAFRPVFSNVWNGFGTPTDAQFAETITFRLRSEARLDDRRRQAEARPIKTLN